MAMPLDELGSGALLAALRFLGIWVFDGLFSHLGRFLVLMLTLGRVDLDLNEGFHHLIAWIIGFAAALLVVALFYFFLTPTTA